MAGRGADPRSSGSTSTRPRFRQLETEHGGDGDAVRAEVLDDRRAPAARCRTRSPAPAACSSAPSRRSARSRRSGLDVGDRVATLVSLTLTPLRHHRRPGALGRPLRAGPGRRHAILFARSIAAVLPDDLAAELALAVIDVCGAPALTAPGRRAATSRRPARRPSPSSAARASPARCRWPPPGAPAPVAPSASCPSSARPTACATAGLADEVALADARDPVALAARRDRRARRAGRRHRGLRRRARAASTARSWPPPTAAR